jgi:epoxyqueuosine reductase
MQNLAQNPLNFTQLAEKIKKYGIDLGFQQIGITDIDLAAAEEKLQIWLANQFHGEMNYMEKHGMLRARPNELQPGTIRIITARMDYLTPEISLLNILKNPFKAYISRYALGRDYHKLLRKRLEQLAQHIQNEIGAFQYRVFCDSAPVMEKPLAEKSGLGWIGKNTNIINSKTGSWFFLGVIFTDLPLPIDNPATEHCGSCNACLDACPTNAFVAPFQLDARRCISYLTIEYKGIIPESLRKPMGNRIYGCDDCQIVCPWNKFANYSREAGFEPRHQLGHSDLITLFNWSEKEFKEKTQGSAIRRISYEQWQRNIAIALGNAPYDEEIILALTKHLSSSSEVVKIHVEWALQEQLRKKLL